MKLYNVAYSGNSYKVRLLLAQLGIPCEIVEVDILKGESRTPEFLKINPNGRTPVLDDNGFILAESNAILAYLARGTKYLPDDRKEIRPGISMDVLRAIQPRAVYRHFALLAPTQTRHCRARRVASSQTRRRLGRTQNHGRPSGKERLLRRRLFHRRHRAVRLYSCRG